MFFRAVNLPLFVVQRANIFQATFRQISFEQLFVKCAFRSEYLQFENLYWNLLCERNRRIWECQSSWYIIQWTNPSRHSLGRFWPSFALRRIFFSSKCIHQLGKFFETFRFSRKYNFSSILIGTVHFVQSISRSMGPCTGCISRKK